ncbi:MAG: helicase-exonuclease AddAB subunit AddA [Eubacteriales bacterium]|nr:helicase-exonuclease AddAB subunit AddA [Eubacteriales bacterium]
MGMEWTKEQREVIDLRDCDILVSAAAGSGKTAVLVERILTMLTDIEHPVDIDRLLIVTFTNAAAGEMKERIREALEEKLQQELPEALEEHLQRQTSLLQNAQVTTIHSFCQYVIRNYFHTIDLEPDFRIMDEGEQKLLQGDVMAALLEEKYAAKDSGFLHMAECFAPGRDDHELEELVLQLYHFSMSDPWPKEWLQRCALVYDRTWEEDASGEVWLKELCGQIGHLLKDVKDQIMETLTICRGEDGPYMYEAAVLSDLQAVENALGAEDYAAYSEAFRGMPAWARLAAKKDEKVSEEKRELVKSLREQYKKTVNDLKKEYFYAPMQTFEEQMKKTAPAITALLTLTAEFMDRYAAQKRKKNYMDFDDLEHFALKILVDRRDGENIRTNVAKDLSEYYHEIMIDEYQDSNYVQEVILTSISKAEKGEHNLFMVGDVKQSIYRFRLARPELFMQKYQSFQVGEGVQRRIDLHKNFRSRSQVLTLVNYLFRQLMAQDLGGVLYDDAAALYPGAEYPKGASQEETQAEILLVETDTDEEVEETVRELEARAVGERIRELVGSHSVWDRQLGAYRTARYGDIVILLRTISGWAEVFTKVFTEMGIPSYTGSRTGYFSAAEVQTMLALLKLIDNPRQEIPLTSVLYSPLVGLSGEELAGIRSRHPEQPFDQACRCEERLKGFFEMLEELREKAVYLPMHELLWEILDRTGYGEYAAAMPGGEQRRANLDMLVEKAMAFEAGSYRGLYNFVRYIENLHRYDVDFGEAGLGAESGNTVRIMSIHKSKGLEFPIVVLSGMGKQLNRSDTRSALILHADYGVGCDSVDPVLRIKSQTLLKKMMKRQVLQENLGEELRVLYVALTRAKEKLILAGHVSGLSNRLEKWAQSGRSSSPLLSFTARGAASCYWDWVMPAILRNQCAAALLKNMELSPALRTELYEEDICTRLCVMDVRSLLKGEISHQVRARMTKEELRSIPQDVVFSENMRDTLQTQLLYRYPYAKDREIPAKVSVSELKKRSQVQDLSESSRLYEESVPVPMIPEFLQKEQEVRGAARGTIYHKFMECLDFAYTADCGLRAQLDRLVRENQLLEQEADLIDLSKLERFLEDELGRRMAMAQSRGELYREQQFVLAVSADEIQKSWSAEEQVMIQGIIDAFFIEDGEIVLVDYKTDFVKKQEASSLYEKYRVQLECYEKALERLMGLPVKEKLIYSFCLNRALSEAESGR